MPRNDADNASANAQPSNIAAFLDVDGTITRTTIAHYYIGFRLRKANPVFRVLWLAAFAPKALWFLMLDRFSRTKFVRNFYRQYRGVNVAEFLRWQKRDFPEFTEPRIRPGALKAIQRHREQGHRIVLVSGGLEQRVAPLAQYLNVDEFITTRLVQREGRFTGEIEGDPLVDGGKVLRVREYAKKEGVDLSESYAYGDSKSDIPILSLVGHPVAVSKELAVFAKERGWEIEEW